MKMKKRNLILILGMLTIGVSACGPRVEPTPTLDPVVIMTQVAMTVEAEVTQAALLTPSPTATQPPTPTPPPAPTVQVPSLPTTPASGPPASGTLPDNATFIEDVTVPDGEVYWQNEKFTKTWKIENSGTTTWDTTYKLIYFDGALLTETTVVSIQNSVAPGSQLEISVVMQAPSVLGEYTSYWKMINGDGQPFGDTLSVVILVGTEFDKTPTPAG